MVTKKKRKTFAYYLTQYNGNLWWLYISLHIWVLLYIYILSSFAPPERFIRAGRLLSGRAGGAGFGGAIFRQTFHLHRSGLSNLLYICIAVLLSAFSLRLCAAPSAK